MKSVSLNNFRSLKDTGEIDVLPLTFLVGKNSSGKSTFLRFFPLIKQSLEVERKDPVLWYSNKYVDFGSFEETLNNNTCSNELSFSFKFMLDDIKKIYNRFQIPQSYKYINYERDRRKKERDRLNTMDLTMDLTIVIEKDHYKKIHMCWSNNDILYIRRDTKYELYLNNELIVDDLYVRSINKNGNIFPEFHIKELKENKKFIDDNTLYGYLLRNDDEIDRFSNIFNCNDYFLDKETVEFILKIILFRTEEIEDVLINLADISLDKNENEVLKTVDIILRNINAKEKINKLIILSLEKNLRYIERAINIKVSNVFDNINYIAPIRAQAERYYRTQGLSINKVDPRGENVAMLLSNMQEKDIGEFKIWLKENLDMEIEAKASTGHISIVLIEDGIETNLTDTGFGYSQILPILITVWLESRNNKSIYIKNAIIFVIEQPELHLHPALQAQLMDMFIKIINKQKNVKFIIETHSPTILSRVGQNIYKGHLNEDDVNVLIFDKVEKETTVKVISFDELGNLVDWPIGFFTPGEI